MGPRAIVSLSMIAIRSTTTTTATEFSPSSFLYMSVCLAVEMAATTNTFVQFILPISRLVL